MKKKVHTRDLIAAAFLVLLLFVLRIVDGFVTAAVRRGACRKEAVWRQATEGDGVDDDDAAPLGPIGDGGVVSEEDDHDDDFLLIPTKIPTKDSPSWGLGNCFDQFLNQCTIQSFMFLLKTCRDPQTILWIESFTQPAIDAFTTPTRPDNSSVPSGGSGNSKLLSYHGLAAINTTTFPTWDSYFRTLLEQPQELYLVESWQTHIPSYEMEINPASLCTRLISVREQIAREFVKDLSVLSTMGGQALQTYWRRTRDDMGTDEIVDPLRSGGAGSFLFLEAHPNDDSDYAPSPLRKGNFDLLTLLATQESIHRVLNNDGEDENSQDRENENMSRSNRQYLSNFYLNRLVSVFTGRQRYGQADQFLQDLLLSAPSLVSSMDEDVQKRDTALLVDPTRIVEEILSARQQVAIEWARHASNVPDLHIDIKRLQLNLLMKSYDRSEDSFQ